MRALLALSLLLLGCTDHSRTCGTGTLVEDGVCIASVSCGSGTIADEETGECVPDGTRVCTNGTRFDTVTGTCQVDPNACQNGTVLVANDCVDPTTGMVVDLEEGPEPNGLGYIEASTTPAGKITVEPGAPFVVHGRLAPHGDAPDVDTFYLTVAGQPTESFVLEISADGVGGVAAGFGLVGVYTGSWPPARQRFGIDLGSDTSKRRIYPVRGGITHVLSVGDVRTMLGLATNTAPSAGGTGDYYLSVSILPTPTPIPISVPSTTATSLAHGDLAVFEATLSPTQPAGTYHFALDMPAELAVGSLVVGGSFAAEVDGAPPELDRSVSSDATVIVDTVLSLEPGPVAFTLTIQ